MLPKIHCKKINEDWVICDAADEGAVSFNLEHPLDMTAVLYIMNFMCWYQHDNPTAIWGGVSIEDAMESLQLVARVPDIVFKDLKAVVLGTYNANEH